MKLISNKPHGLSKHNRLMNMKSKEEWINEVMESSTGLEPVTHQPFLYRKTLNALQEVPTQKNRWTVPALASIALLIFLNSFMVINYQDDSSDINVSFFEETDIDLILEEYSLNEEEISLYNF